MKYGMVFAVLFVFCVFGSGCATTQQTFTLTPPDGPFCIMDGTSLRAIGNINANEDWFRMANVLRLSADSHTGDGWGVVEIERDTGVHQNDFEGKSFIRTVEMTARPSEGRLLRTNDGTCGIILVNESSGRAKEVTTKVLDAFTGGAAKVNALNLSDDGNTFIIMIANGENENEVVIRKNRYGSERVFVAITTSTESVVSITGFLSLYLPTYEELPPEKTEAQKEAERRETDEIISELEEKYKDSTQGD